MSNGTKKILLIGNGFDIRAGAKTTFREFFRFVIYGVILYNYSKSEVLKCLAKGESSDFKIDYEKYFDKEKIKNQVQVIADLQRKKESKNFEKKHPGEKLYPSKHPLEILLEIGEKKKVKEEKEETVFYYCRKLIETKFGKMFFGNILNCNDLEKALRINLTTESLQSDELEHLHNWFVIYGLTDKKSENQNKYIPDDTTLGQGIETIAHIVEANFDKNSNNISLWSDVETVIELLITQDVNDDFLIKKYGISKDQLPIWNHETIKGYYDGLEIFEFLLAEYFKAITDKFDIEERFGSALKFLRGIYDDHLDSLFKRAVFPNFDNKSSQNDHDFAMLPDDFLEILYNPDIIINFNYTDIAEGVYQKVAIKPSFTSQKPLHIHIHGKLNHSPWFDPSIEGLSTDIVIGYRNYNNISVPKELYNFEKSCRRITKGTTQFNLDTLVKNNTNYDLLIIGHSCCLADSDIIGNLLTHEKLNNALILCNTKDGLTSINNNIRQILTPEKYVELTTLTKENKHNLLFAVNKNSAKKILS